MSADVSAEKRYQLTGANLADHLVAQKPLKSTALLDDDLLRRAVEIAHPGRRDLRICRNHPNDEHPTCPKPVFLLTCLNR